MFLCKIALSKNIQLNT